MRSSTAPVEIRSPCRCQRHWKFDSFPLTDADTRLLFASLVAHLGGDGGLTGGIEVPGIDDCLD
ncbi:MAG: hypothetical protein CBC35_04390 [Planctomycetes bacterium TMED75]|nr:hypothetical protein [Planctomycetaceae bacterium]OUU94213.1 MAG: hypothetical protein CBC35_04390 [Planctomycetes bacterium TMED75]